jgi:hypothetical protein
MSNEVKVRPDIQQWLTALRDPASKQAIGTLKEVDADGNLVGYCCLGLYHSKVLGVEPESRIRGEFWNGEGYEKEGEDSDSIDEGSHSDYSTLWGILGCTLLYDKGIEMNDSGHSFLEIADMIESNLDKFSPLETNDDEDDDL